MDPVAVASGFGVGAIVGLTGVGGGSLMTPLLMGVFKLHPAVAIGTDLCFAGLTKSGGAWAHQRLGHVDWPVVRLMLAGSLPATAAAVIAMQVWGLASHRAELLTAGLGVALLLTAVTVAHRGAIHALALRLETSLAQQYVQLLTVAAGVLLGVLVAFTSIGAGAIGATLIVLLHPRLAPQRVVGTDIAHAVPLTLVAGAGHALLGHVDWSLLGALLVGSLPGIWLGARLTRTLPEPLLRTLLCLSLAGAGIKTLT